MKAIISTVSGDAVCLWVRPNNDSSSTYNTRSVVNGSASSLTSTNAFKINPNTMAGRQYAEIDMVQLGNSIHMRGHMIQSGTSPSTAPTEITGVSTFTSGGSLTVSSVMFTSGVVGTNWSNGTEIVVLGHD